MASKKPPKGYERLYQVKVLVQLQPSAQTAKKQLRDYGKVGRSYGEGRLEKRHWKSFNVTESQLKDKKYMDRRKGQQLGEAYKNKISKQTAKIVNEAIVPLDEFVPKK